MVFHKLKQKRLACGLQLLDILQCLFHVHGISPNDFYIKFPRFYQKALKRRVYRKKFFFKIILVFNIPFAIQFDSNAVKKIPFIIFIPGFGSDNSFNNLTFMSKDYIYINKFLVRIQESLCGYKEHLPVIP